MHAFSVPRDVELSTQHGWRRIRASVPQEAPGGLDPARLILAIHDEDDFARRALASQLDGAAPRPGGAHDAGPTLYAEAGLARWPGFPVRLGRRREREAAQATAGERAPLHRQLVALRERRPRRRHFRVALVGGFGFNLGDTLMGATAWRILLPVMRTVLGSVSASVLLGPLAHPAAADLIGHEEGIDDVQFMSPSLQDFSRYDAYFDFTGLVALPRFNEGPALDWILWWLGLAPGDVAPAAKRNRLRLPAAALDWARERLGTRPGPRVVFVWRASTPLRSMPDELAARLAADLLDAAPGVTLVTERAIGLAHPRLLDLGATADSAVRMMALVAEADGLLTVDSLAPHVADAADVPTVMLLNSFPATRFPFYPNMHVTVPPSMASLPGWGVTKVADELWDGMKGDYARAWEGVSASACWASLAERMAARPSAGLRTRVEAGTARRPGRASLPAAGKPFPRDVAGPLDRWVDWECSRLAARILGPGRVAVLAGGGNGALALAMARHVSPRGILHVLEPRRLRAQKLAADAEALDLSVIRMWAVAAGSRSGRRTIPDFDPLGEAHPGAWGNLEGGVEVGVTALDDLALVDCHALVVTAPQEVVPALSGAAGLLGRAGPVVIAAPVRGADTAALRRVLDGAGYRGFVSWADRGHAGAALLVAVPRTLDIAIENVEPLG